MPTKKTTQKLVPELRFPEFRVDGAWNSKPLGKLSRIVRGGSPRPIDGFITEDPSGLNWLKIADVEKGAKYVTMTKERVRKEALAKTREVHPGNLILSNSMSFGRPYILKITTCIHDGWIAVSDITSGLDNDFLYYSILAPRSQTFFLDQAAGGGVRNLNADIIKALPCHFPHPPEQQKIADCLGSLDELLAAHRRKLAALQDHKKGLLQQLFPAEGQTTPNLRFPGFEGEWEETSLQKACLMKAGKFVKAAEIREIPADNLYPCYGGNGLRGYTTTYTHMGTYSLIGRQGALCGNVQLASGRFHATEHAVVADPAENVISDWLFYALTLLNLNRFATGQAQPGLSVEVLERVPITIPALPEQQKIADCLSALDALITAQTAQIAALQAHKNGLMQKLFPNPEGIA